jgi:ABC-type sugar transport system ATPase subunit
MENLNLSPGGAFFAAEVFHHAPRRERSNARRLVEQLGIKTPSLAPADQVLSGGNQQKVILGRWLCENPQDYPAG